MKKSLFMTGLIALILMMVSCNNIASPGGKIKGGDDNGIAPGMRTLTGTIEGIENRDGTISRSARDIMASARKLSELKFFIEGTTDKANVKYDFQSLTIADNGTFAISLEATVWQINVYAQPTGETSMTAANKLSTAVLMATAFVDLTGSSGDVKLILSTGNLTRSANVSVVITPEDEWFTKAPASFYTKYTVTAGMYKLTSGELVGTLAKFETTGNKFSDTDKTVKYSASTVTPGTYAFTVTFTNNDDPKKEYCYTEKIFVEPGNNINNAILTVPNILGTPPVAPASFEAYYADPREDGTYALAFKWVAGTPAVEKSFVIELVEYSDNPSDKPADLPSDATEWESAINGYDLSKYGTTVTRSIYSTPKWVDGGLASGSTDLVMRVDLGTQYIARIKAVNNAAESEYTYVTLATAVPGTLPTNISATAVKKGVFGDSDLINLFMMKYDLNGGNYTDTDAKTSVKNFFVYDSVEHPYITVTYDTASSKYQIKDNATLLGTDLQKGGSNFVCWKTFDGTTYSVIPDGETTYAGPKNKILYANYTPMFSATTTILDKNNYKIDESWVTVNGLQAPTAPYVNHYTTGNELAWTFEIPELAANETAAAAATYKGIKDLDFEKFDRLEFRITSGGSLYRYMEWKDVAPEDPRSVVVDVSTWNDLFTATYDAYMKNGRGEEELVASFNRVFGVYH